MSKPLYSDPIVAEIHAARERLLDDCSGDVVEFRQRLRDRQAASGREVVSGPVEHRTEPCDASADWQGPVDERGEIPPG
jgi:hypothetical protein